MRGRMGEGWVGEFEWFGRWGLEGVRKEGRGHDKRWLHFYACIFLLYILVGGRKYLILVFLFFSYSFFRYLLT